MSNTLSFKDLANASIASYKGRDSSFAARLQFWIDLFGDRPITGITPDDVDDGVGILTRKTKTLIRTTKAGVVRHETDKPLSGSTVNRYVASLGTCFKDLRRLRLLPRGFVSPMRGVERQPEGEARDIGDVTHADIRRLIACCRVSRNRKLAALVAFSATTGWRQGSVAALTWGAVDLKAGFADTRRTKNGSPHRCVLQPFVIDELRRIKPDSTGDNDLIFGKHNVGKACLPAGRVA